jgi:uncharacterized protein DUF2799
MTPSSGFVLLFLVVIGLGGCAAVSKEQCVAGDWADLGKAHASVGKPANHLDEVVKSCGKHGITPNTDAYQSGWNQGLQNYCTPLNGFTLGKQNKRKSPICPPQMAGGFSEGYRLGHTIWTARDRVDRAESDISSLESRAFDLSEELDELSCKDKKGKDRKKCRRMRKRLRADLHDTDADLSSARYDLEDLKAQYEYTAVRINAEASYLFSRR